jgi:hypothetical protein
MNLPRYFAAGVLASAAFACQAQSVFFDGFEATPEDEVAYACDVEGIMPNGWNPLVKPWGGVFAAWDGSPSATYPNGISYPAPVGANKGQMTIVPFVPNPEQAVLLHFDDPQSRPADGYQPSRPSNGMWFAISPCPGDMRAPDFSSEPFLRPGCRTFGRSGTLIWTTQSAVVESDYSQCKLEAGKTYYMTISPTDVIDGLQIGEDTCRDSGYFGCEVGVVLQTSS